MTGTLRLLGLGILGLIGCGPDEIVPPFADAAPTPDAIEAPDSAGPVAVTLTWVHFETDRECSAYPADVGCGASSCPDAFVVTEVCCTVTRTAPRSALAQLATDYARCALEFNADDAMITCGADDSAPVHNGGAAGPVYLGEAFPWTTDDCSWSAPYLLPE